ncbi:PHD finger protein rhinoceros [Fasciolopsis buskii]|uniref:PHD finger protein rhinoceros n=1 Tax=Fasciolopsis buskii TaxID=27845 RepID=A0A8E0VLR7_9TREM|nr:PHD finger protein rhinoceros [Fasciolopsis buski]
MILSSESEVGKSDHMVLIENPWKSEWHKNGVQVPVQLISELPVPFFRKTDIPSIDRKVAVCPSPGKLWHEEEDSRFNPDIHILFNLTRRSPVYRIDEFDQVWVTTTNEERECLGEALISEWMLEDVIEALEHLTFLRMQEKIKELEGEALEFDENAKCDVCLSVSEDGNELVFCDGCFLCVHQACYGIPSLPEGSWICRRCEAGAKSTTPCALCPNTGGAMKKADDGVRWCHLSCALWVPEVAFGNIELMEPVVRLDCIPQARRSLLCCICRCRYGAPIQCYNKKCKTAFHVTCAFQSNLTMRQELVDKDVRLVGLCPKHSRKDQQHNSGRSPSKCRMRTTPARSPSQSPASQSCVSSQQSSIALRKQRLLELENDFHKLITDPELAAHLISHYQKQPSKIPRTNAGSAARKTAIPEDIRLIISSYWRLKRRANFNQPLISPVPMEWRQTATEFMTTTKEALDQAARVTQDMIAFDAFRRIRFGLDRARLVLDMVLKRERRKLALFKRTSRIIDIQLRILTGGRCRSLSEEERLFISNVHIGDSIYDNAELFSAFSSGSTLSTPSVSRTTKGESLPNTNESVFKSPPLPSESRTVSDCQKDQNRPVKSEVIGSSDIEACDLSMIPREQFIVPEDIRQRLRSALSLVSSNRSSLNTGVKSQSKTVFEISKSTSKDKSNQMPTTIYSSPTITRSKRSFCSNSESENIFSCFNNNDSSDEFKSPTPAKRANRRTATLSQSSSLPVFGDHSVPVLSKFATIKLGPGAVRLL